MSGVRIEQAYERESCDCVVYYLKSSNYEIV